MQVAIVLNSAETLRYEEDYPHDLLHTIAKAMEEHGSNFVLGDDGEDLYDIGFEPCAHRKTYLDDRSQEICRTCGEELGR
jgi:histidinol phosphatase-like PHP family hydrolase